MYIFRLYKNGVSKWENDKIVLKMAKKQGVLIGRYL